jgi:hypothetical protein
MEDVSKFHITIEPSHAILAQACLGVLLRLGDRTSEDSVKNIPLYKYASEYWVEHAQVGNVELKIKDAIDHFFDMDKPHFAAFSDLQGSYDDSSWFLERRADRRAISGSSLILAASLGLSGLAERLIAKCTTRN